jgi:hypothetical protein
VIGKGQNAHIVSARIHLVGSQFHTRINGLGIGIRLCPNSFSATAMVMVLPAPDVLVQLETIPDIRKIKSNKAKNFVLVINEPL